MHFFNNVKEYGFRNAAILKVLDKKMRPRDASPDVSAPDFSRQDAWLYIPGKFEQQKEDYECTTQAETVGAASTLPPETVNMDSSPNSISCQREGSKEACEDTSEKRKGENSARTCVDVALPLTGGEKEENYETDKTQGDTESGGGQDCVSKTESLPADVFYVSSSQYFL